MPFNSEIAMQDAPSVNIPKAIGDITFILGPNGSGKSALMHRLYRSNSGISRRITAHRQNWLQSNFVELAPSQMKQQKSTSNQQDMMTNARYSEWVGQSRTSFLVYELLNAENFRSRKIADLVTNKRLEDAAKLSAELGPLQIISELLNRSNMPITINADENDALIAVKSGSQPFSISALSDGERNALFIAAHVTLAAPGSLLLIDEPERHLHRAIMTPFLNQLIARRPDCAFVISTHDLDLAFIYQKAHCVLVRACAFQGEEVSNWHIDLIDAAEDIDADFRKDILDSRQKIVFIEGEEDSLDEPLYSILLPNVSLRPKGSCKEVVSHVRGIRNSEGLHWVKAFGLVDRDQFDDAYISKLKENGIFALSSYSVESIYYYSKMQEFCTKAICKLSKQDPHHLLSASKAAALAVFDAATVDRLAARMVERTVKQKLVAAAPSWKQLKEAAMVSINIDAPALFFEEVAKLKGLIQDANLDKIIERYPIRTTAVISKIVDNLTFSNRGQYEVTALTLVSENEEVLAYLTSLLGDFLAAVKAA